VSVLTTLRSALGVRGLGYRPDKPDGRDRMLSALGLPEAPLDSVLYESLLPQRLRQGGSQSCVAHAWAQAIQLDRILDGDAQAPLPSRRAIYRWARDFDGGPIRDAGTYLRSAARAVTVHGIPPESVCPFELSKINAEVPWAAYRAGHDARGPQGYYRISPGDLDGIRRALSAKKPVVFGLFVPRSFLALDGPATIDVSREPAVGGHAVTAIGYDKSRVRIVNWWTERWREGGCAWLTNELMAQALDVWVTDFRGSKA